MNLYVVQRVYWLRSLIDTPSEKLHKPGRSFMSETPRIPLGFTIAVSKARFSAISACLGLFPRGGAQYTCCTSYMPACADANVHASGNLANLCGCSVHVNAALKLSGYELSV
jgi:hypothetical protein